MGIESINRLLFWAARNNNLELVKSLVEQHQADINSRDEQHKTLLDVAIEENHTAMVEYLLNTNKLGIESINRLLFWAARYNKLELFKCLVEEHQANINTRDEQYKTVLDVATEKNHTAIVEYLVNTNKLGMESINRLLFWAARYNKLVLLKCLVEQHQADINARDEQYKTVLDVATEENHIAIVEYLVNTNKLGMESIIRLLFWAARCNKLELVKCLVEKHQADINARDEQYKTLIDVATEKNHTAIVDYFLNTNKLGMESISQLLFWAARSNKLELIKRLVEQHQADINARDEQYKTLLDVATEKNHTAIIQYLVNTNKLAMESINRLLLWAARYNKLELVKCLVEQHQADMNAKDTQNKTVLDVAKENNRTAIVKYINAHEMNRKRKRE